MKCKFILITMMATFISACTTSVNPSGGSYSENKPTSNQAKLILYRTGGALLTLEAPIILMDSNEIGTLPEGGFLEIEASPGIHAFEIKKYQENAWRFKPYNFKINMQSGTTQFIELDVTSLSGGWIVPLPLVTVAKTESKFELKKRTYSEAADALSKLRKTLPTDC